MGGFQPSPKGGQGLGKSRDSRPRNRPFITLLKSAELTVRQYFDGGWGRPYDEASDDAAAPLQAPGAAFVIEGRLGKP